MNKKAFILILCACPILSYGVINLFFLPLKSEPERQVKVVKEAPNEIEVSVRLTKWQLEKMLSNFYEQDHPSEMRKFNSVVKKSAEGWYMSSTHLVRNPKYGSIPSSEFHVVDSSSIDFSGSFKKCVEYADSYKNHHDYILVKVD